MTLKEKLMKDSWEYDFPISNLQANYIIQIADNYAIEFSEWCNELRMHGQGYYEKTTKELLEIFKKEKGL
jgi:hypothetical protein